MDHTFFLLFEISALAIFFYCIEKDTYQGLMIFFSTALFLVLSLAAFDLEKTFVLFNSTSGAIESYKVTQYDSTIAYLNGGLALISAAVGIIKTIIYAQTQLTNNTEEE